MDPFIGSILGIVVIVAIALGASRLVPQARQTCNRCNGTGQVNERWPDPSEPGGWHIVEGTCPKCKGKGKIAVR